MPDWIEDFLAYTSGLPSPEIFRLWAGITAVSGALERRVWAETGNSVLYPNLYTMLIGPPATGKSQAINPVRSLWYATKTIKVSPDDLTKPSLIDALVESQRTMNLTPDQVIASGGQTFFQYHSLAINCSEFGVLLPQYEPSMISFLTNLYDNPAGYREKRRSFDKENDIANPQITILAGTQPGFLAALLPEVAWNQGFTSRFIMVYSGEVRTVNLFNSIQPAKADFNDLAERLKSYTDLFGRVAWTQEAQYELQKWNHEGCPPVPEHSKLEHYRGRRILHTLKLAIISAISRGTGNELMVELEDVDRARFWLLQAEIVMPDIFRQMAGKSDGQVMKDLHYFCWERWAKTKMALHESLLIHFLSTQVPAEKITKILEMVDRAGTIKRVAGHSTYIPTPVNQHGME